MNIDLSFFLDVKKEGLIATVEGRDLQINTSILGRSTFSRAAKYVHWVE